MLLRLVGESDVVLESFRPGVLDRLGAGYEAMREVNPAIVYCAITGYGQDGPLRDRSGHDMNYLGLVGLLGLTGDAGGPPVQAAGQIADLGGGALMAAFGILAALRERDRSGEGQLVDVSMADGALSWLAMVAARYLAEDVAPRRGDLELAGSLRLLPALRVRRRLGHARRPGAEVLAGLVPRRRARRPRRAPVRAPGSATPTREVEAIFHARTREEWRAFASEHDCCLEPVLDLDEALELRARARARDGGRARPARRAAAGPAARGPGEAQPHAGRRQPRARARAGRAHARGAGRLGYGADEIAALLESGRRAGRRRPSPQGIVPVVNEDGPPKMSELAERSGVSAGTIKHYLREGLLGEGDEIVRTSRNMAYYPPEYVERIRLIKRLQEDRFMPLRVIK